MTILLFILNVSLALGNLYLFKKTIIYYLFINISQRIVKIRGLFAIIHLSFFKVYKKWLLNIIRLQLLVSIIKKK